MTTTQRARRAQAIAGRYGDVLGDRYMAMLAADIDKALRATERRVRRKDERAWLGALNAGVKTAIDEHPDARKAIMRTLGCIIEAKTALTRAAGARRRRG